MKIKDDLQGYVTQIYCTFLLCQTYDNDYIYNNAICIYMIVRMIFLNNKLISAHMSIFCFLTL